MAYSVISQRSVVGIGQIYPRRVMLDQPRDSPCSTADIPFIRSNWKSAPNRISERNCDLMSEGDTAEPQGQFEDLERLHTLLK
jgi:hypothetical protein